MADEERVETLTGMGGATTTVDPSLAKSSVATQVQEPAEQKPNLEQGREFVKEGELISTIEQVPEKPEVPVVDGDADPEKAKNIKAADEAKTQTEKKADDKVDDGAKDGTKDEKLGRLDEHPRFKEVIEKKNSLQTEVTGLQAEIAAMKVKGDIPGEEKDLPYVDLSAMSDTEISDWARDKPQEFNANLALQVNHEVFENVKIFIAEEKAKDNALTAIATFADSHEGYAAMDASGELGRFVTLNPGHNEISAFLTLTQEQGDSARQTEIDEAVEKAKAETKTDIANKSQAGRDASTISASASPGSQVPAGDNKISDDLLNPKDHGGTTMVLGDRVLARRKAAGQTG